MHCGNNEKLLPPFDNVQIEKKDKIVIEITKNQLTEFIKIFHDIKDTKDVASLVRMFIVEESDEKTTFRTTALKTTVEMVDTKV